MGKQRLNHCYAPGCSTGYNRTKGAKQLSLFKAPADPARRSLWERNLHRGDKPLTADCAVCELHFEPHFIVRDYVHQINGEEVRRPRGKPTLKPDAVPTILPNAPPYLSKRVTPGRSERKRKASETAMPSKKVRLSSAEDHSVDEPASNADSSEADSVGRCKPVEADAVATVDTLKQVAAPNKRWTLHELYDSEGVCFTLCALNSVTGEVRVERAVFFTADGSGGFRSKTFLQGRLAAESSLVRVQDATTALQRANEMILCCGAVASNESSLTNNITDHLRGKIESKSGIAFSFNCHGKTTAEGTPCVACKYLRKALVTRQSRVRRRKGPKHAPKTTSQKLLACNRRNKRLLSKVHNLAEELSKTKAESASTSEEVLAEKIRTLSPKQQLAVRQCFEASKRKSTRGMTYDKEWILECILLKIRSPKLYRYMRKQGILTLPSETTIRKYTAQYRSGYGFNERMLSAVKRKTAQLDELHRHGGIVIDEMKLSEHLSVSSGAKVEGLVDLGAYTPKEQKSLPCNHGLVVMFVPLVGSWTQVLGVFASHENVKGELLAKIVVEATILAEKAGLLVDYVTCDAASWNRKMWKVFNVRASLKEVICKRQHPADSSRSLYFFSDFPHLVKNVRNRLLNTTLNTPDGQVSLQSIKEALKLDTSTVALRAMPGINDVHVAPNNFEKMRASYAFQLFGQGPLQAFFLYRTQLERKCGNIEATEKFFKRMKSIISIMTARYPAEALRPNSSGVERIKEMLDFLNNWERCTNKTHFLSDSTAEGLRVTLTSTLELLEYLHKTVGFKYLLTSRLSQDKVENFFGIVRMSSGCNAHPTPQQFLLTVHCLSFYNLAQSVVGGNADACIISSLLDTTDKEETCKEKFLRTVESTIGDHAASPRVALTNEHEYHVARSDSRLIYYISGYVVKKCVLPSKCPSCISSLLLSTEEGRLLNASVFVQHKDNGGLLYPSVQLYRFITHLEDIFTNCFSAHKVQRESVMDLLQMIHAASPVKAVGCTEHKESLTPRIVGFYITMRLHFFVKGLNKSNALKRRSAKHLKLSRLN